jgi:hypothetical protein
MAEVLHKQAALGQIKSTHIQDSHIFGKPVRYVLVNSYIN